MEDKRYGGTKDERKEMRAELRGIIREKGDWRKEMRDARKETRKKRFEKGIRERR